MKMYVAILTMMLIAPAAVQAAGADDLYNQAIECQRCGPTFKPDLIKARGLLDQAAAVGNTRAMLRLAAMLMGDPEGGAKRDDLTAFAWFKKAADAGSILGMYRLGECYKNGNGTAVDLNQANALFARAMPLAKAAAVNNDSDAMYALALSYDHARGVAQAVVAISLNPLGIHGWANGLISSPQISTSPAAEHKCA